jgi:hypothetical protein
VWRKVVLSGQCGFRDIEAGPEAIGWTSRPVIPIERFKLADTARELVVNKVADGHGPVSITVTDGQKIRVTDCKQFVAVDAPLVKGN